MYKKMQPMLDARQLTLWWPWSNTAVWCGQGAEHHAGGGVPRIKSLEDYMGQRPPVRGVRATPVGQPLGAKRQVRLMEADLVSVQGSGWPAHANPAWQSTLTSLTS
jgi:hypothetical protein